MSEHAAESDAPCGHPNHGDATDHNCAPFRSVENDALTGRREAVRREAAHMLWAWGWYDLAEIVAPMPSVQKCRDCGADWKPVRRGECSHCGSDNTPIPPARGDAR